MGMIGLSETLVRAERVLAVFVLVTLVSCGKGDQEVQSVQPISPLENVAAWPTTHAIASSSAGDTFRVSNLNDGTMEAWGAAEGQDDVHAAVVLRSPLAIQELRIRLFSPGQPGRPHLRDIRVITADSDEAGKPQWSIVRSRLSISQAFSEKVTVPPLADGAVVRVELDRSDPHWGPHRIWGFGCFTASHGDARNYLPPGTGTGIYVRELQMSAGHGPKLVVNDATPQDSALNILASLNMEVFVTLLVAILLLGRTLGPVSRFNVGTFRRVFAEHTSERFKPYFVAPLLLVTLAVGLLACVLHAFSTDKILHWDETYYANIAVMGTHGLGLYAAIQNMLPTHIQGGVGYMVYLYVLAVQMFGASIYSLRAVALIAGIITLVPIYLTLRMWYDSLTGLVAIALMPSLYLFRLSNTARMDYFAMAAAAWMLFAVVAAFQKQRWRWHLLAGLVAGLALQAHIDTLAVTIACGLFYVVNSIRLASRPRRWPAFHWPIVAFVLGFGMAFSFYVAANIVPDVQGYFHATNYARPVLQSGTLSAQSLLQSVLSPQNMVYKELQRYQTLFQDAPRFESLLFSLSLVALAARRAPGDKNTIIVVLGAGAGAAVILYNASPFYFIHLFPLVILPLAPLFTHGFTQRGEASWRNMPSASIVALVISIGLLLRQPWADVVSWPPLFKRSSDSPVIVAQVQRTASPECRIAGNRTLYVPYFLAYPRYYSTTLTEENLGTLYLGGRSYLELWTALQPDVVFGSLDERIRPYVEGAQYKAIEPDIWLKTEGDVTKGCVITMNKGLPRVVSGKEPDQR